MSITVLITTSIHFISYVFCRGSTCGFSLKAPLSRTCVLGNFKMEMYLWVRGRRPGTSRSRKISTAGLNVLLGWMWPF